MESNQPQQSPQPPIQPDSIAIANYHRELCRHYYSLNNQAQPFANSPTISDAERTLKAVNASLAVFQTEMDASMSELQTNIDAIDVVDANEEPRAGFSLARQVANALCQAVIVYIQRGVRRGFNDFLRRADGMKVEIGVAAYNNQMTM